MKTIPAYAGAESRLSGLPALWLSGTILRVEIWRLRKEGMLMSELMSVAEIRDRFRSEWVLLKDPEFTRSLEVKMGTVLWHSKDRSEVYRKARELRLRSKHSAVLYVEELLSAYPKTVG